MLISIVFFLIFLFICIKSLKQGLIAFAILTFFTPKAFILLDVSAIPLVTLNRALVIAIVIAMIVQLLIKKKLPFSTSTPGLKGGVCLTAVMLISCLITENARDGAIITTISFFIENFLPAAVIFYYASERLSRKIIYAFTIAASISAIYALATLAIDFNPFTKIMQSTNSTGRVEVITYEGDLRGERALGTFSHPITLGAFMCFAMFGTILSGTKIKTKYVFFSLFLVVIYLTNSRSPILLLLTWLAALIVYGDHKLKIKVVLCTFIIVLFASVIFPGQATKATNSVVEIFAPSKVESLHGSSIEMRKVQLAISYSYFMNSPLIGNGVNTTRDIVASKTEKELYNSESVIYPLMIDTGILGVFFFFSIFVGLYSATSGMTDRHKNITRSFIVGYIVFILATGTMDTLQVFLILICTSVRAFPYMPKKTIIPSKHFPALSFAKT